MGQNHLKLKAAVVFVLLAIGVAFFARRILPPFNQPNQRQILPVATLASGIPPATSPPNSVWLEMSGGRKTDLASDDGTHSISPSKLDLTAVIKFSDWVQNYLHTDAGAKASDNLLAIGEKLALNRRAVLKELIQSDPRAALAMALTSEIRGQLPGSIARHLEETISGRGDFRVTLADDLERARCAVNREITINGKTYAAFVYGRRLRMATRPNILVQGIALDQSLAILDDSAWTPDRGIPSPEGQARAGSPWAGDAGGGSGYGETAEGSFTQGTKTLLFMPVAFSDDPTEPITQSAAIQLMSQVNAWFTEQSYNSTAILADVTPLLVLPQTKAHYAAKGVLTLQNDARTAALAAGFDTSNYDFDIVNNQILGAPNFNFAGFATVGGKGLILQVPSLDVTVHELGHNYGLWHANFWSAAGESVIGPGSTAEYGNAFDTMGARNANPAFYDFNACFKNQLDWLPFSFVQTVTTSGRYRISAFDVPNLVGGQKYALRVQKDYVRSYWAEFRQKFTGNPWTENGVLLNWNPWNNYVGNSLGGTVLLDTTPGTPSENNSKDDAPVVIGRTFSDVAAGVHITPVIKGGTGADNWIEVQVNLGSFPSNGSPTLQLAADQVSVGTNVEVHFSATAADPDGDPLAYDWNFGDLTFGSNSPLAMKSWSRDGEYVVHCTVSDMKGGLASRNLIITVGAPNVFQLSGRITTASGQPLEGARIDNGLAGSSYRGAYTDSDGNYSLVDLDPGSYTIRARKYGYDLANVGWSNPVNVGPDQGNKDWVASPIPVVSVSASDPTAAESGGDAGVFTLTRSGELTSALTVKCNLSGSATYAMDYSLDPTPTLGSAFEFTIPAGVTATNILLTSLGDLLPEGPETVVCSILEDSAYSLGPLAEAVVTIIDNQSSGMPTVTVTVQDDLAPESASDAGGFYLTRSGSIAGELVVHYSVSGTASNGVDYTPLAGVAIIPAGATNVLLAIAAIDDAEVEGNEMVEVTISPNAGYLVGPPSSALITIVDDDPVSVTLTATENLALENSSIPGSFTVTRVGNLAANLLVHYSLSGTAANGVDFIFVPGTVTIPGGQSTVTFNITPLDDGLVEGEETVVAALMNNPAYNIGNPGTATVLILDDDIPGITLTASDTSASESDLDPGSFTFTRTGSLAEPLTVYFNPSGTARKSADYAAVSNSITIPAASTSAVLTIAPLDDGLKEDQETVVVTLQESPTSAYSIATTAPQSVTLSDNDSGSLVGVAFATATASGPESQFIVNASVTLSAPSPLPILVDCQITGGTAINGVDYATDLPTTLYFPAGLVSQSVTILGANDNGTVQSDRTVVVTLSNPVNAQLDAIPHHTYTILDDDGMGGAITVAALVGNATESGLASGTFRVARSGVTSRDLPVRFQLTGTASSPSDFLPVGNSAVIPAGQSYVDLLVQPVDDMTPEAAESVTLTLTSTSGASLGTPNRATLWITDNDSPAASPIVSIVATDPSASETGLDTGTFTIRRDRDTNAVLLVDYSVSGTAAGGSDYASLSNSISIPAGSSEVTIAIAPIPDAIYEADETIVLTLTVAGPYRAAPAASRATVMIREDQSPPVISGQPQSQTVVAGSNVTLTAVATANPVPNYQWFFNSVSLPGATFLSLTRTNFQTADQGRYYLVATNLAGAATSQPAMLYLDEPLRFTDVLIDSNGFFRAQLIGLATSNRVILASSDLTNWTSLITNANSTGIISFTDTNSPDRRERFYRAQSIP